MIWNYPVSTWIYALAGALALAALIPRVIAVAGRSRLTWIAVSLLFVVGMVVLPSANHLMGDGITHLSASERVFSATEPLDVFLHHLSGKVTGSMETGYRVISFVSGLFFLLALSLIARLFDSPLERVIVVLAFLGTATLQFYFGHVESYTLLHLFTVYYLYFAWRDLRSEDYSLLPLLFFVLALLSHFSGIVLLPSLVYLYRRHLGRFIVYVAAVVLLLGLLVAWKANLSIIMVPLAANSFSSYSLLSTAHLLDLLRLLVLVCPLFFLALMGSKWNREVFFTVLALAGGLVFTILVDPKIGAFRDWDLLSLFALPCCALVALRVPRHRLMVAIMVFVVTARIVPWLIFNNSLQVDFVKSVIADDLHYSQEYDNGRRLASWGVFLKEIGDFAGAETAFVKRLEYQPDDARTLTMLIPTQFKLGKFAEAHRRCLQGLSLQPDNVNFRYKAIYTAFRINDTEAALRLWSQSPQAVRETPPMLRVYAGLLALEGRHQEAVEIVRRFPLADSDAYLPYVLARSCLAVGDVPQARQLIARAVKLDSNQLFYKQLRDSLLTLDKP